MPPPRPESRKGLRQVSGHFSFETWKAIGELALEMGMTRQAVLALAINGLLEKNGKPRFADEEQKPRGGAARHHR